MDHKPCPVLESRRKVWTDQGLIGIAFIRLGMGCQFILMNPCVLFALLTILLMGRFQENHESLTYVNVVGSCLVVSKLEVLIGIYVFKIVIARIINQLFGDAIGEKKNKHESTSEHV